MAVLDIEHRELAVVATAYFEKADGMSGRRVAVGVAERDGQVSRAFDLEDLAREEGQVDLDPVAEDLVDGDGPCVFDFGDDLIHQLPTGFARIVGVGVALAVGFEHREERLIRLRHVFLLFRGRPEGSIHAERREWNWGL
ncbi:MAG: hypothetical protein KDJ44_05165 [Rhodoblastus sp.]|nr:hypothetical protein [Rhodoblastus sp.]